MIEMSARRVGAPATAVMGSVRRPGEPLAGGESAQDLHASVTDVAADGDRPQHAPAVVDDDRVAIGGDRFARRGDHAARLVPESHGHAAPGEQRAAWTN